MKESERNEEHEICLVIKTSEPTDTRNTDSSDSRQDCGRWEAWAPSGAMEIRKKIK